MNLKVFNFWLLGVVASFLAYLPAVLAFFIKDDIALLNTAEFLPAVFQRSWPGGFYRPFAELFFALEYSLFQIKSVPYHIVSYVAHVLTSYVVRKLAYLIINDIPVRRNMAALIFLCHPVNTETVSWISGQMSLMGTLCSVLVLLRLWSSNFQPSWRETAVVALLFVIGCGFYENFILIAGIVVIFQFLSNKDEIQLKNRLRNPAFLMCITASSIYMLWRFHLLNLGTTYLQLVFSIETATINLIYYMYLLLGGTAVGGRIIRYEPDTLFEGDNLFHVLPPFLLANTIILLAAIILSLLNRSNILCGSQSNGFTRAFLLSAIWIALSLAPVFLIPERPRRLPYMAVPGFAFFMTATIQYLAHRARLNAPFVNTLVGVYLIIALWTLNVRNSDWSYVGSLEKSISNSVSVERCSMVLFDVPTLIGDALFFNSISTSYLLKKQYGREVDVHLQNLLFDETHPHIQNCTYRLVNGKIKLLDSDREVAGPLFTRGHNWMISPQRNSSSR